MNYRERVLKAIRREKPDRVPLTHGFLSRALINHGQKLIDLFLKYPNDFFDTSEIVKLPERDLEHYRPDGSYFKEEVDEWGCLWHYYQEGLAGEVKKAPLEDWANLKNYRVPPIPNAEPEGRRKLKEDFNRIRERFCTMGGAGTLFERMQWLRGVEDLLADIAFDSEEVYLLADLLTEQYLIPNIEIGLEAGVDIMGFSDDWGSQFQLLIHPEKWRKIFKPRYAKMFNLAHEGGALTWMHSDGMTMEIIPDLIEIGLDVMNPQIVTMDMRQLREMTQDRLTLLPDIDRQWTLPFGTPKDVKNLVTEIMTCFKDENGGLIMGGEIGAEVSLENAEALLKTIYELR